MRFLSKKTRGNNKISIFTALLSHAKSFVVSCTQKTVTPFIHGFSTRISRRLRLSLFALLLVATIGGVSVHFALSQYDERDQQLGIKNTLLVYPSSVSNTSWSGTENVLSPDLDEDSLYQDFSARNSAYVPLSAVIIDEVEIDINDSEPTSTQEQDPEAIPADDSEGVLQDDEQDTEESEEIDQSAPEVPEEDIESEELPEEESEVQQETQEDEAQEPQEETEPVTLKRATESLFTFLGTVTELFPFMNTQEETLAPQDEVNAVAPVEAGEEVQITPESVDPQAETGEPASLPSETQTEGDVNASTSSSTEDVIDEDLLENEEPAQEPAVVTPTASGPSHSITLSDFSTPELQRGEFITGMQLRMSLGAQYELDESGIAPTLEISFKTPSSSEQIGTIIVDQEISNALNGGYFLFALPQILTTTELNDVAIEVTYSGDTKNLDGLYLDAVWLEINVERLDKQLLQERLFRDMLKRLHNPELATLLSDDKDFTREELPQFSLRYNSQRNIAIRFFRDLFGRKLAEVEEVAFVHSDVGNIGVTPQVDMTDDGLLSIQIDEDDKSRLRPGEYSVELTINEGGVLYTDSFTFQWGLLSINPDQSSYVLGDEAKISLGALSPNGNTICDADLALYVIDPEEALFRVPVTSSGLCNGNNVIDVADYSASFVPTITGEHEMYLERIDVDGTIVAHTIDTFLVEESLPFTLERNGPSRVYPRALYPMEISVTAVEDWEGTLVEKVPSEFIVSETDAAITVAGDDQELSWAVALIAGETQTFSYIFDTPDISPFLYTVGSARLEGKVPEIEEVVATSTIDTVPEAAEETLPINSEESSSTTEPVIEPEQADEEAAGESAVQPEVIPAEDTDPEAEAEEEVWTEPGELEEPSPMESVVASSATGNVAFEEHRQWQIASDATGSMIAYWVSTAAIPSGWTCLSCGSGTFYQRFPMGGATYNTTGGATTHTHSASGTVAASATANAENNAGSFVAISSHAHTYTPTISTVSSLPAYRQMRIIQNNSAGEPASIPAGAALMFDATLPSGWARYTALDGRYPRGENSIANGGSNTHTHTITGSTAAASGSTVNSRTGGTQVTSAANTHTHTVSSNTGSVNMEPPYIEVLFATSSSATSTPTGAIAMWSDTPPAQWLDRSSQVGDPFYERFVKGAATYGTTGGNTSHTHANVTGITSSAAVGTDNARTGATGSSNTHTHAVDATNFTSNSHLPPYVTAIFGKKFGPIPMYTQLKYRIYANTNANTPTDAWPTGVDDLLENEPLTSENTAVKNGDVVRLRMQLSVSNSTSTSESFKLQFASTTALCSDISTWTDVGSATSSAMWRGYNNAGVSDGATLSTSTLTGTDVLGSYEETNPSVTMPNTVGTGQSGEWDFVVQQNTAYEGATYCFRMVEQDGTPLFSYTEYPTVVTNEAPEPPVLLKLFDNEKVGTTTPDFEFTASDAETNDVSYQIQIDDDYAFGSTIVDRNTVTHSTQFENLATPADKDPFTNGETIRFNNTTALSNGTTYYWRVRAQDPNGSNQWGQWATIQSFTIDTSVTVSTWFQTMEEQFDANTLSGVEGVSSDQAQLRVGSTTGTMYSDPIEFEEGELGTAWGEFVFADTETSSDLKYTIQYNDNGTWTDIPNADLAGNTAGFDTSPVSLLGVDKTDYPEIRIEANFTNSGATPSLQSWSVDWDYLIETPTIAAPFANEKVATTTPTFEFTTTDPQSDDLIYQVQWSTTYAFTASTTRSSNLNAGFTNINNGGDTSPFTSGDSIQFKVQGADALTNGTTYWWRVRARDPLGANTYSFYTDPRSFTVDTSVTVSTWFQTTQSQFDTDILSGAVSQSGNTATVATTSDETLIAYAEGTVTTPRYRQWDGSTWGTEANALDVGATINWVVTKASPVDNEYILATMGTDADVNVQVFTNGAWGNLQEVTTIAPNTTMRGFDVTYEQLSGDGMVVTCDGDADPSYYIWNGSSWTNGGAIGLTGGNTCGWVRLISDPISDEIIAITRDTTGVTYEARVWNGSSWGNSTTWGSMTETANEGIAASYEDSGNQAVVAVSNGGNANFSWRAWNGATWSAAATVALGDDFEWGTISADDGTDNMALCYVDEDSDIGVVRWTGAAWVAFVEQDTAANSKTARPVDCIFEVGGSRDGYIMMAYSDTTNMRYRFWNGAVWSAEATLSTLQDASTVQLRRTGVNLVQLMAYDDVNDRYDYSSWNGTTWAALQTLETNGSVGAAPFREPFMQAPRNPSVNGTVIGDPLINFYEGSGPYWQQMSWTDTESGGSTILYQLEYWDGNSWELIPNSLISNNSTGNGTSPISLTNVLPASTYDEIRPVAKMTCNAGTCPVLSDWTITWAAGITISGTAHQYDQVTNVTTGTVGVALNGVVQVGKTGTIAAGAWSIANVNAAPGDVVTVFVSGAVDASEAVAVSTYDGVGNMSGINLYQRHLTIGSDDLSTITNASLGLYDFTNTEDIFFDVNGSNDLSMCATTGCADAELFIKAGNIYQSGNGGDVITHDIEINGTLRLNGNTMRVSGSWDNNATTTLATSTVIFTATSTSESINETGATSPSFYNLTFGETSGTATWTLNTPLDVNNTLTVSRGTLARGSVAITVAGNVATAANGLWTGVGTTTFDGTAAATWSDASAGIQNIGNVVIDGTTKSVTLAGNVEAQSLYIGADDTFDLSPSNYDVYVNGSWINNNTFNARSGDVFFTSTSGGRVITAGSDNFYNVTFNGSGGAWSFTESTLGVNNNFAITAGTVTMPTATTTISGSFTNSGTFAHNNSAVSFIGSGAKTITQNGGAFTNAFYNVLFAGSGSWTFTEANATTSNRFSITQGSVTLPSNTLTVGDSFINSGGTFTHNSGTVRFTSSGAETIDTNSSFNSLRFAGSGSWSFVDATVTALGSVTVSAGTLTLPSGTLSVGGSFTNTATVTHNSGTVLFNSADTGETISLGASSLYNMTFNSASGGWTISAHATSTNNTTLTAANSFTLASGQQLAVGGTFTNSVGGAVTTWTGSTLSLNAGSYSLNAKTNAGDAYNTLRVAANTDIKMWNSSAATYTVDATGSLYSQDHNAVDGDLYIYGNYPRTSGSEYWSYATDFDGTSLGTTSRQVDVRFASSASASFTNSTLNISGISTATTTVANQGAGTYTLSVIGGTTTAAYYSFANLGTSGVSLLGSNEVTSLGNGAYLLSTAAGTGLTVSSTTIDANPGLQIFNVNFSTSSPVVANNVSQTDGTPASYWWFRNSSGNKDGEANDFDTGDPGSIRWDDSSLIFTVSGTVYSDDGTTPLAGGTCNGVATPVRVVVEGGATYDGTCSAVNGSFSIPGVVAIGDPTITVFLNGASGGQKAVTVTKTPTTNIANLDLYANRVITRHEDTAAMTIADMASYDSTDDGDILFTAATSSAHSLTLLPNSELFVWATTTFTPGGTVTLNSGGTGTTYDGSLHVDNGATFTGSGTTTYSIGGSFRLDAGATFVPASSTVLMTATTTGKTLATAAGMTVTFDTLRFTGSGGGWNINGNVSASDEIEIAAGTVTGTGNITLPNGSIYGNGLLSLGAGTTTISRSNTLGGTQGWTFYNLYLGNGTVVGTTTPASVATTTIAGRLTIATAHFLDAGASHFNLSGTGTVFVENGNFLQDTSTVRYSGGGATSILSTAYYNLDLNAGAGTPTYTATGLGIAVLNNLSVGGANTTSVNFDANDSALDVNGNVVIASNGTLIASNTGVFTVAGSWDNNGTFTGSGGTVTFDGSGSPVIAAGNSAFGNVILNGSGSFTISEHATTSSAFTISAVGGFTLASGQALSVGGVFTNAVGGAATTWTGSTLRLVSGTNYQINAKTISDAYATLVVGANTDIRMWNSSASSYNVDSSGSLYSQDHNAVDGDLYVYGNYAGNGGTDYWSYATDFDGTVSGGRQVDVRFASGASMTLSSGGLQVLGTASASTSLQNQGSGTYGLLIGGTASTSWSYYDIEDTNSSGLTFSGAPTVVTLSRGDFEVSQGGGSAITVGGSVLNANPAKTFTNNNFSTTTGITGFNVTATGTSVSSWRFTNHTGTIDGEAYDVDPNGDPGYVVWDDSSANITISGNVYSDEGSTVSTACDGSTNNILVRVAGLTTYTSSCNAGTGLFSVSGVTYSPGDSIIAYIDGETEKGATVTKDPVSNINNMHIYENRVIVRHENTDPIEIADMAVWDSSDDADIPFTAINSSPDTLNLPANRKLLVWTGKEFEPNGNVTVSGGGAGAAHDGTFEAQTNAIVTFSGAQTHSIGGSFILNAGATFDAGLSTTTFTTSGASRTIDINDGSFYNIAFTGSGSWTVTDSILDVQSLTKTSGTLTFPTGTTTVSGSFSNTGGTFTINGSTIVFDATSAGKVVRAGGSNFEELIFNGTGGSWSMSDTNATSTGSVTIEAGTVSLPSGVFAVGGNFRNEGGVITHNTSEIVLTNATSASLLASGSDLYAVAFRGAGNFAMEDQSLALLDDLRILQGSVTFATGTLSIGGSLTATGGTFDNATGTILFNSSDAGETVNPGTSPFYNVVFGSASGGWTVSSATTTNNFTLSTAASYTQTSGTRLYVGNVFTNSVGGAATTWTGSTLVLNSGSPYSINTKTVSGDLYATLSIGANTDIKAWNSSATTPSVSPSGSFYSQDHAAANGALYIYGDFHISTTTEYWSYATDFDGTSLGGSPRVVTVSIAANATTTVDGGTLNIIGASGNSTTITNQGSGTYAFKVNDGTFNGLYYAYRNLNAAGLHFTETPTITSLSQGDFELAVNGGSLITLASSSLNANASMLFTGNRFATTSAITGTNVELVGTTSNAWTFVSYTGSLSGEDFDDDGITACGSIRWNNSACLLTQQTHYRWRHDDGGIDVPNSEWFNSNWDARKSVRLQNPDAATYSNAVVKLEVAYDADMQTDFDDLRFTDASGTTTIPHFIERYTASTDADVWVEVPSLEGEDMTTIFMYFDNPTATSTSSSGNTFIVADDFEDGGITEYSGDTGLFTVDGSFAYGGSYGLDTTGDENSRATDGIGRTGATVAQNQIIRYMQYVDPTGGSGDEVCTMFGLQSPVTANQNYAVCLEQVGGTDRVSLARDVDDVDTSGTILASTTVDYVAEGAGWYEVEIDWQTNDDIDVTLSKDGSLIASISDNDGTYTSGGIGFTYWFQHGGWDNYTSRVRVETEPTVYFGDKQTDGGASWAAAIDDNASYVSGDVARLRLAIENSGLQITGQTFDLEFAEKGAAPSCEAVSDANYSIVPPQASCGSSALCMQTSSNITDSGATTDLLFGTEGQFIAGEVVEDPSNTTAAMTIDQNEYTELEYAITPTVNANEPAYCLRATDAGDPVDTYLSVAELTLRFDPVVTNVSLNSGADISLVPGTTTTVYATGTVTDLNGYVDLVNATSTIYRSGVTGGAACTGNNNDCYISTAPLCTFYGCAGNSCEISCSAEIYFHADATDADPYEGEEWVASIEVRDQAGSIDIGDVPLNGGVEVFSLPALDVTSSISYGSLAVSSTTGSYNPTTTVQNLGNIPIDIRLEGTDLTDGGSSFIPTSEQIFATSTFTYTGCTACSPLSSTTPVDLEVDLSKPTSAGSPVTDIVYWGIEIPYGVASNPHSGTNTFYAVSDSL